METMSKLVGIESRFEEDASSVFVVVVVVVGSVVVKVGVVT